MKRGDEKPISTGDRMCRGDFKGASSPIAVAACFAIAAWLASAVPACDDEPPTSEPSQLVVTQLSTVTLPPAGVRVLFAVEDEAGEPVSGLTIDDVQIFTDGRPIEEEGIAAVPVLGADPGGQSLVSVVLDLSSAVVDMGGLDAEFDAALELVSALVAEHRVAVSVYGSADRFAQAVPFTSDLALHEAALGPSGTLRESAGLGTRDLNGSAIQAFNELDVEASHVPSARRSLVLFAGGPDQAMIVAFDDVLSRARAASDHGTRVFVIDANLSGGGDDLGQIAADGYEPIAGWSEAPAAALRVAHRLETLSGGTYVLGLCSPRVSGEREIRLVVTSGDATGELTVTYDATGFDLVGCDPALVADPCGERECGLVLGFSCGVCGSDAPYCNQSWACSPTPACPGDMVMIPSMSLCIDRYEASEGYGGVAVSEAGAQPWVGVRWADARDTCEAAGKRLCSVEEWAAACAGPTESAYPYGDTCVRGQCNGTGTAAEAAGSFASCEGGYPGLFDMTGNVQEWTSTCNASECRMVGGGYQDDECASTCAGTVLINTMFEQADLGFRCCLSLE
jgi:hypothetical protein